MNVQRLSQNVPTRWLSQVPSNKKVTAFTFWRLFTPIVVWFAVTEHVYRRSGTKDAKSQR